MKNLIILLIVFYSSISLNAQNNSCVTSAPFCTGSVFNFPANVNAGEAEAGPDYGCLGSQPNPAWYFMQVEDPGDITIFMVGTSNPVTQTPTNDIDFICYGPFNSFLNVCSQLTAANTVDCSFSAAPTETVDIADAQSGEFYIILITNYSNTPCNIIFSQTGGAGSTSCGPFNNGPLCVGQDLQLLSFFNAAEYTFSWTGPNGFTSSEQNPIIPNITIDNAGTYTLVTANPTDTTTGSTVVEIAPSPNASSFAIQGDSCIGGTIQLIPDSVFANATYNWGFPNGNTQNGNPLTINPLDSTVVAGITLTYTIDGCTSPPVTLPIDVYPNPIPFITGENHTCADETTILISTQNYPSYSWSNSDTTVSSVVLEGSFVLTVVNQYGCVGSSAPFVVTNSDPRSIVNDIIPYCKHDSILIESDGTFASYAWYDGKGDLMTTNNSTYTLGDKVTLVVVDDFGCKDSVQFDVPSTLPPVASFTTDPLYQTVLLPATIQYWDTSIPTGSDPLVAWIWTWNPNTPGQDDFVVFEQHPLINFPDTGYRVITLVVTSEIGCKDTVSNWVYIIDKPFVPNVFSPGGDGYNDYFKVPFIDNYPNNLVLIFNRWGKKVFEGNNYKGDWDGDNLPSGTYYYVVSAPSLDKPLKGAITLIRN